MMKHTDRRRHSGQTRSTTMQGGAVQEHWVFYLEVAATVLIALGALLDMLVARGYLSGTAMLRWLEDSLFVFQIPIYYLAFGYVYERTWFVHDGRSWARCMGRQLILCLTPFLSITLLTLFVDAAIGTAPLTWAQLAADLFSNPVSPVGFYPILLLMYALTPTLRTARGAVALLSIALVLKIIAVAWPLTGVPYVVSGLCASWIWFCAGMACGRLTASASAAGDACDDTDRQGLPGTVMRLLGTSAVNGVAPIRGNRVVLGALWLAVSVLVVPLGMEGSAVAGAVITFLGLLWSIAMFSTPFGSGRTSRLFSSVGKVTIGIFLLHPVCLSVLFRLLRTPAGERMLAGASTPWLATLLALLSAYLVTSVLLWAINHIGRLGVLLKPANYLPPVPRDR